MYLLKSDGTEISHRDVPFNTELDADVFGTMFQAVKIYVKNPSRSYGKLRYVEYGGYKILVERGKEFFLVVIGKGDVTDPVREYMKGIVENINERYGEAISHWEGDVNALDEIGKEFDMLIGSQRGERALMKGDQSQLHIAKGDMMSKKSRIDDEIKEEIKIPWEYIEKIDKIVRTGVSVYPSREDFIKSAVEIKLAELKGTEHKLPSNKKLSRDRDFL